jgi:1-acyl-sn-glycerol-3-phosphate acyltransferase
VRISGATPQYWIARGLFRLAFATYFRWRVYNPERVPAIGQVILAANHASFMDPPLVGSAAKRAIHYLARDTLFRFPGVGATLRSVNAVPVSREGGALSGLRAILEQLELGEAVVLFPEGTRSRDGNLLPAQPGIGLVAIKSGASVVPVRVFGSFDAFSRDMKFPRPRKVSVKFGKPIRFEKQCEEAKDATKARLKEVYADVAAKIMEEIASLKLEP